MVKGLQSVQEHISSAPGSYLSRLRTKFTQKSGLVQNSKIQSELCEQILSEERLKKWVGKKNDWEILAIGLIYASLSRGLHLKELERNLPIDQKSLLAFLNEAAEEMFIWRAKCFDAHVYWGFADFEDYFLNALLKKDDAEHEPAPWISNERKEELHLLFMLAKIQLKKISIKKDNTLSHVTKKHLTEIFGKHKSIDNALQEDCLRMHFSFLAHEQWICKDSEGTLKLLPPAYEFLQKNGFRLFSEFFFWWKKERFKNKNDLLKLIQFFKTPISAYNAAHLFWAHNTYSRLPKNKGTINWAYLPLPLRELWILGILKMQMKKKHILSFCLSEFGENILFALKPKENLSEPIVSSSSNFEWLVSQSNGALRIFEMSCFAKAKNEEELLRFALSKESFLEGLRSELPDDFVHDFFNWNKAVPNVKNALNEWYRIYNDSSIDSLQILRIKNSDKFAELCAYKPLIACVEEIIPNWGFVIKPENEKKIRGILLHFALEPKFHAIAQNNTEPFTKFPGYENFKFPYPIAEGEDVNF